MSLKRSNRKRMEKAPVIYSQSCEIAVMADGYVGTVQNYDSFGPTYAPDYEVSGLSLFPRCQLINPDSPVAAPICNERLSSFEWYEVTKSGAVPVHSASGTASGYQVVAEGEYKGQITVGKNGTVGTPRAMRFVGYYAEDGYIYKFEASIPLVAVDVSSPGVELSIDSDKTMVYNPLRMQPSQTISATVMKGDKDVTDDERVKLMWYRRGTDGTEAPITAADDVDNIEVVSATRSKNGSITSLTIDRDLIGSGQIYAVYAIYRADKAFPSGPGSEDARQYTNICRQFPQLWVDIQGDGLHQETDVVHAKAIVSDNQGIIEDWGRHLYASWKVSDGTSEKEVARGEEVTFGLESGKTFFCDLEDRGTCKVLASDDGEWLLDEDGCPIIARDYEEEQNVI